MKLKINNFARSALSSVKFTGLVAILLINASLALAAPKRQNLCLDDKSGDFGIRAHCKPSETDIDVGALRALISDANLSTRGEKGEVGPQGARGETGAQGPRGEQGPQGERGAQGERGLQGEQGAHGIPGAPGLSGYEVVSKQMSVLPATGATLLVRCPAGKAVIGGGGIGIGGGLDNFRMLNSLPTFDSLGFGWQVRFMNEGTNPRNFVAHAICANVTL